MGKQFKQMSHNDRIKMEALLNAGHSKAEVAEQLHFHRSTIYIESTIKGSTRTEILITRKRSGIAAT